IQRGRFFNCSAGCSIVPMQNGPAYLSCGENEKIAGRAPALRSSPQNRFHRIMNFGAVRNGLIDLLSELFSQGLHVRFDENPTRVGGQLDDLQTTGGDSSPAVVWIAQEGIISSRLADRHFPRVDLGFVGQE